jgi:hypothetical protein
MRGGGEDAVELGLLIGGAVKAVLDSFRCRDQEVGLWGVTGGEGVGEGRGLEGRGETVVG